MNTILKYINMMSRIWILGLCWSFFTTTTFGQEKLLDEIIAVVGDNIILNSEVKIQEIQAASQGYESDNIRCEVIDQLLLERMFVAVAVRDSLEVSEAEVDAEVDGRMNYFISLFGGDEKKLEEYYGKTILALKDDFKEEVRKQLLARKVQGGIVNNVKVTPAEVKNFFNTIPKDSLPYFNATVELGQLVIKPSVSKAQKDVVRATLLDLKKQIEEGEDFGELAKIYSQDPGSAIKGGDLGWQTRGQFVPEFEGAAFKLKDGEMSDIVETAFGLHLIKMIERKGNKIHTKHILIKPEVSATDLTNAKQEIDSIRNLIVIDTLSFKEAVEKFSDDESTKNSGGVIVSPQTGSSVFEMDALDPTLYFTIDTLTTNQLSKPTLFKERDGSQAYKILYVYNRAEPHLANLKDDYEKVQNMVKAQKQQEVMLDWIDKNVAKTYIKIDDEFMTCPLIDKWKVE